MLASFLDSVREGNLIAPRRMAERLSLPLNGLAKLAQVNRNTLSSKPNSPAVQKKLGEIARIVQRATELSGNEGQAIIWFKYQTIIGFGMTAEELVEKGHADLVMEQLDRMEHGVYS